MRLLAFCFLLLTFNLSAELLESELLSQAQSKVNVLPVSQWLAQPQVLEENIRQHSKTEQVLLRSRGLKLLSSLTPTPQQQQWVKDQLRFEGVIEIVDGDHRGQTLEVVNIQRQAQGVLSLWAIHQQANQYWQAWDNRDWSWPHFHQANTPNKHQALATAMEKIDAAGLSWLVQSLVGSEARVDNQTLFLIARSSRHPGLMLRQWQQPPDAYTYKLIQLLPELMPPQQAIHLLQQASVNEKLRSQTYLLMAKHYSAVSQVQRFLLDGLQREHSQWDAAMALSKMKQPQLMAELEYRAQRDSSPALQFALKGLKEEQNQ